MLCGGGGGADSSPLRSQVKHHLLRDAPPRPQHPGPQSPVFPLKAFSAAANDRVCIYSVYSPARQPRDSGGNSSVQAPSTQDKPRQNTAQNPPPSLGASLGARQAPAGSPGPPPGLTETKPERTRAPRHHSPGGRPRSRPPDCLAPGQHPGARCVAPARRPRSRAAPPAASLPRAAEPSPPSQYELPAAFADSQLRSGAGRVALCSMGLSHWLGGERERRGEREREAGRSLLRLFCLPRNAGRPGPALPLHAGRWSL